MLRMKRFKVLFMFILSISILVGCTNTDDAKNTQTNSGSGDYPITIEHAFGKTSITSKPERIVTISWGNQDIPLALGVVPVGASKANYGVIDKSGLLPWTRDGYEALGTKNPILFDDTDSLDFEAISDARPDVILAAYSGITQEDYNLLSQIAPVVAYQKAPWQTLWREQTINDATGMAMKREGEELVAKTEQLIANKKKEYAGIEGKTGAFFYFNPSDLGKFYVYLPEDPRAAYLEDLGLSFPDSLKEISKSSQSFALEMSAENIDKLKDVDVVVAYGDETLLQQLQTDALLSKLPAIQRGSVAMVEDATPLAASMTPTVLSIPTTIDEYMKLLQEAALKVQ